MVNPSEQNALMPAVNPVQHRSDWTRFSSGNICPGKFPSIEVLLWTERATTAMKLTRSPNELCGIPAQDSCSEFFALAQRIDLRLLTPTSITPEPNNRSRSLLKTILDGKRAALTDLLPSRDAVAKLSCNRSQTTADLDGSGSSQPGQTMKT